MFYSRKNFKKPHFQQNLYKDFKQEVAFLDTCFKNSKYRSYRQAGHFVSSFGDAIMIFLVRSVGTAGIGYCMDNGDDRWYLYTLHSKEISNFNRNEPIEEPDQTIEILMSDLDEKTMNNFRKDKFFTAAEATKVSFVCIFRNCFVRIWVYW